MIEMIPSLIAVVGPWSSLIVLLILLGVILGRNITISSGKITIRSNKIQQKSLDIMETCRNYYRRMQINENQILRNQMTHAEGVIKQVCDKCGASRYVYDYVILKIRSKFKENGLESLSSEEFSSYVGNSIDLIRSIIKDSLEVPSPYLDSAEFSNNVAAIFNSGLSVSKYYKRLNDELERSLHERIQEITNA